MSRIEISVKGLFATPVAAIEVPGRRPGSTPNWNALILAEARRDTPSVQASNAGGWHSDRDIHDLGGRPRLRP